MTDPKHSANLAAAATCEKCGGATKGFKCDVCGAESPVHVEAHACGGAHCMPKCAGCYEAVVLCECAVPNH